MPGGPLQEHRPRRRPFESKPLVLPVPSAVPVRLVRRGDLGGSSAPRHARRRSRRGPPDPRTAGGHPVSPEADAREFEAGYKAGFATGYDVGRAHGVADESAAWTAILT